MKIFIEFTWLIFNVTMMNAQNQDPWTEYMTPSSVHNLLSHYEGSFVMEITMATGTEKELSIIIVDSDHTMFLGGRFRIETNGNYEGYGFPSDNDHEL